MYIDRIRAFLDTHKDKWHENNIPGSDGKLLYEIITEHKYRNALEIGASTGHSGIWIARALKETGGKLITTEINEKRYQYATSNFREAGVSEYIDLIFGDAYEIIKKLDGPFDLVFCDADKDRYKKYFDALYPKLTTGGCYLAHNVFEGTPKRNFRSSGIPEFVDYIKSFDYMATAFDKDGGGMSISYKIK